MICLLTGHFPKPTVGIRVMLKPVTLERVAASRTNGYLGVSPMARLAFSGAVTLHVT